MLSARLKRTTRYAAPLGAAVLAVALTAAPAGPALADGTLTVSFGCEYVGANNYICTASAAGGVAPYSYAWSGTTGTRKVGSTVIAHCGAGNSLTVTATDAAGDQASASLVWSSPCQSGPPN